MLNFDLPKGQSSIIKVIGVGGGGNNAVNHMFELGIKGVDFINCNTDQQVLDASPVPNLIRFGTQGLGAGANPEVGRKLAEESADEIREILEKNTQMLFITAGMGGGTGTGSAPIVAAIARELGILTIAIVTEPFSFEGKRRMEQAKAGIQELRKHVDVLLVIKNDKLREQYGNLKMTEAFHKADNILANAAKGMAEIISVRGYVNVDFEDAKTVMRNSGSAIMGVGVASGEDRAARVVDEAVNSPLLDNNEINGAKNILLYITYGDDEIMMDEMTEIIEMIRERTGDNADLIFGHGHDERLGNNIAITVVATGFDSTPVQYVDYHQQQNQQPEPEKPVAKEVFPLNDEVKFNQSSAPAETPYAPSYSMENQKQEISEIQLVNKPEPQQPPVQPPSYMAMPQTPVQQQPMQPRKVIRVDDEYFDDFEVSASSGRKGNSSYNTNPVNNTPYTTKREDHAENLGTERKSRLSLFGFKTRSKESQEQMENVPAYLRKDVKFEDVPSSSESQVSRYTLFDGENGTELRSNNSFLHDNVD